jgi:hypothetical protein
MRQLKKTLFWIGCLALGLQTAGAFSLLGPIAGTPDASWQITLIGYNPLNLGAAPPFFLDPLPVGPKNLGEGYRRNAPTMYYAFDPSFEWFGSNGEFAVQQAFDLLNGVMNGQANNSLYLYSPTNGILGDTNGAPAITLFPTNSLDQYSANLTEFPFNTEGENYTARALGLLDVKSQTLSLLMEQLGLADSVRYVWALRNRYTGVIGESCNPPGPGNLIEYNVVQRNFDIVPSALNQLQYSAYVNGELYSYWIDENCGTPAASPPDVDALEIPADVLNNAPPVASGNGEFPLIDGFFYTGLTQDDVGGLRWLYSTNNYDTPSPGYLESASAGSALFGYGQPQILFTSDYHTLFSASLTNSPATLQALFPGLIVGNNPVTYFSNVVSPNVIAYFTNFVGSPAGAPASLVVVTNLATNIVQFYQNSLGNVVTNQTYSNTTFAVQTITVGPMVGSPAGSPFVTNVTYRTFTSNVVSGDYFLITNGSCAPNIVQTLQTNVNVVTNLIVGTTNLNGQSFVENLISYFTNYAFVVQPCALATNSPNDYQGIGRMQFIRVSDVSDPYDYQNQQFRIPITNQYTMVVFTNGQYLTQTFQRVVTTPDFLFTALDQLNGPDALPTEVADVRNINFNQANMQTGLSGPGTINSPTTIAYNKVGPVFLNESPATMIGPTGAGRTGFIWGSFDGTTNAPVVYPNGTSLENLANEAVVQITPPPPALPTGTNGVAYNVAVTASGTVGTVTWTLASFSAGLPPGLSLSAGGVISGTPTQSGTFDTIVVQMSDSSTPPHVVQTSYSLTIN